MTYEHEMDHLQASFPAEFTAMKPVKPLGGNITREKEEKIEKEILN